MALHVDEIVGTMIAERLKDQKLLGRLAMEAYAPEVREAAVERLTDQSLLAKIVVKDQNSRVQLAAIERITDQTARSEIGAVAAKIAVTDPDSGDRLVAVRKLVDQTLLEKIALSDTNYGVCLAAVATLADKSILEKFTHRGDLRAAAQIKLALLDPVVQARLPDVVLYTRYAGTAASYTGGGLIDDDVKGDSISFSINTSQKTIASEEKETMFPKNVSISTSCLPVFIDTTPLIMQLLDSPEFTQEDLIKLSHSDVPELRGGASLKLNANHDTTPALFPKGGPF